MPYEKVGKNEPVCIADEVPFEIPDIWEWVRLGDIIELQSGQDMTPDKYNSKGAGIPYITGASNIERGAVIINRWTDCGRAFAYKGDILLTCKGTVGTMAVLQKEIVHIARQIMAIRPIGEVYVPYIQLVLETLVEGLKAAAKSMIPGIGRDDVLASLFPVPPLDEQHRIVSKVFEIEPHIHQYAETNNRLIGMDAAFPEALKKSILQWAVQGKLVPQDPTDEPAEVLLTRIGEDKARLVKEGKIKKDKHESVIFRRDNSHYENLDGIERCIDDEIPFGIPENWAWIRLGSLLKVESGNGITSKEMKAGNIPVYGGNGITGYHNSRNIFSETVVIGRVGYYCGSLHITPPAAWVTDNAFITTYPEKYINRKYLVYTLRHMNLGKNNNATAQPVVSGKKIYPMLFPLPPLAEQNRIVNKLDEVLETTNLL